MSPELCLFWSGYPAVSWAPEWWWMNHSWPRVGWCFMLCIHDLGEHEPETCAKHNGMNTILICLLTFCAHQFFTFLHWWQLKKCTVTLNQSMDTECYFYTTTAPWYHLYSHILPCCPWLYLEIIIWKSGKNFLFLPLWMLQLSWRVGDLMSLTLGKFPIYSLLHSVDMLFGLVFFHQKHRNKALNLGIFFRF